jgi:histidine triad (HIT) family protein
MQDSIFTKIIRGDIPSHKIYEDAHTFAFLTIEPIHPGHVVVVPKQQVEVLWELPDDTYQAVMATVKKVANRISDVLQPARVGSHVEGVEVPHAHVHLFPFQSDADYWDKPPKQTVDHDALAAMAVRLRLQDEL